MSESRPNTGEVELDAESAIAALLDEHKESVHTLAMTAPGDKEKFYTCMVGNEQLDRYLPYIDWERVAREPHEPLAVTEERQVSALQGLLGAAEAKLLELEANPEVLDLLTEEARVKDHLTVAEQFGPDIVNGSKVVRAMNATAGKYVNMRSLTAKLGEQSRFVNDNLMLLTVPGLLMLRDLERLVNEDNTTPKTGFSA